MIKQIYYRNKPSLFIYEENILSPQKYQELMTFLEAQKYKGSGSRKAKCEYAKKCGVEWDGITNVGLC